VGSFAIARAWPVRLHPPQLDLYRNMEPSPLTQDSRPEIFQPKIITLYETLFKVRAYKSSTANKALMLHRKMKKTRIYPTASGRNSSCTAPTRPV
jgi:hypothetical protein